MLATFAKAYERGMFFDDAEGFLDMDFDVFWELNPHSASAVRKRTLHSNWCTRW